MGHDLNRAKRLYRGYNLATEQEDEFIIIRFSVIAVGIGDAENDFELTVPANAPEQGQFVYRGIYTIRRHMITRIKSDGAYKLRANMAGTTQ